MEQGIVKGQSYNLPSIDIFSLLNSTTNPSYVIVLNGITLPLLRQPTFSECGDVTGWIKIISEFANLNYNR